MALSFLRGVVNFLHAGKLLTSKINSGGWMRPGFRAVARPRNRARLRPRALGLRVALKARREFIFQPALSSFPAKPGIFPAGGVARRSENLHRRGTFLDKSKTALP
jgi:hypothetical protein